LFKRSFKTTIDHVLLQWALLPVLISTSFFLFDTDRMQAGLRKQDLLNYQYAALLPFFISVPWRYHPEPLSLALWSKLIDKIV